MKEKKKVKLKKLETPEEAYNRGHMVGYFKGYQDGYLEGYAKPTIGGVFNPCCPSPF